MSGTMKHKYIKPTISVIVHVCRLLNETMSVFNGDDDVVDDENEILSKGTWGNIYGEEENNATGW